MIPMANQHSLYLLCQFNLTAQTALYILRYLSGSCANWKTYVLRRRSSWWWDCILRSLAAFPAHLTGKPSSCVGFSVWIVRRYALFIALHGDIQSVDIISGDYSQSHATGLQTPICTVFFLSRSHSSYADFNSHRFHILSYQFPFPEAWILISADSVAMARVTLPIICKQTWTGSCDAIYEIHAQAAYHKYLTCWTHFQPSLFFHWHLGVSGYRVFFTYQSFRPSITNLIQPNSLWLVGGVKWPNSGQYHTTLQLYHMNYDITIGLSANEE